MKNLITDVKVKIPIKGREKIAQNFEINSGVSHCKSDEYVDYAMIPNTDWRSLSEEESKLLFTDHLEEKQQVVSVLEPDAELKKSLANFDEANSTEEMFQIYGKLLSEDENFKFEISSFLKMHLKPNESLATIKLLAMAQMEPNSTTVAIDPVTRKHYGLHFDHSETSSISDKKNNRSRICINLGEEHRYIMFINLGIEKVYELVKLVNPEISESIDETDLAKEFFKYYPDYPVIRYKQERFQCYIAPTDYIIHDGSTLNKIKPDKAIVYLGHFNTGGIS